MKFDAFFMLIGCSNMSSSFASQRNTKKFTYYKYFDVSVFINCSKSLGVEKLELPEKRSYNGIKILVASVKLQSLVSTSDPRVSTSPSCLSCWPYLYMYIINYILMQCAVHIYKIKFVHMYVYTIIFNYLLVSIF